MKQLDSAFIVIVSTIPLGKKNQETNATFLKAFWLISFPSSENNEITNNDNIAPKNPV